jgi:hypothetical protein
MNIPKNLNRIPSICKVLFTFCPEIDSITFVTDSFHESIALKTGGTWRSIYFAPGSAEYTEVQKLEDPGSLFSQTLRFVFPGEDENNSAFFDAILHVPLVALVQYSNGAFKIIGSTRNPSWMTKSQKTDSKTNGVELSITCMDTRQARWLKNDTPPSAD